MGVTMKITGKLFFIKGLLAISLLFTGVASAHALEQEFLLLPEPIVSGGADQLDLRFNIQHARVTFRLSEDPGFIAKVVVKYDNEDLAPVLSERFLKDTYSVEFSSGTPNDRNAATLLHDWVIDIGRYNLETALTLDFKGVQTSLDLGGMPLGTLALNLKGSQMKLDFSEPTLLVVRELAVACEGTFFRATHIGNTGFETLKLGAKGSSLDLDFKGAYAAGDYNGEFQLKGSSAVISLPATAGASVVYRPVNRSVELAGDGWPQEVIDSRDGYKTNDYEDLESRVNLYMESAASSILISREGTNLQYRLAY